MPTRLCCRAATRSQQPGGSHARRRHRSCRPWWRDLRRRARSACKAWRVAWLRKLSSSIVRPMPGQWQSTLSPPWSRFVRGSGRRCARSSARKPRSRTLSVASEPSARRSFCAPGLRGFRAARLDHRRRRPLEDPSLMAGGCKLLGRQVRSEVKQHPGSRRGRDPVERRDVERVHRRAVDADAGAPAAGGRVDRHLGRRRGAAEGAQQVAQGRWALTPAHARLTKSTSS